MTGDLILNRDAQVPLGAATKQYVDVLPVAMNDNRIINGDMRIDQRNNGATGTANGYPVDRWAFGNVAGHGAWGRNIGSLASAPGFPYYLGFSTNGAYTPAAGEAFQFTQSIEADAISDLQWGTANAQPVTLSFWAYSNIAGSFSGCLGNYAGARNYPFSFTLAANVWTKTALTIPGDTTGTWVLSGNSGGVTLHFDLGSGANVRGPANVWTSAGIVGVTGAASLFTAVNQYLFLTGVKLEVGSVATPYNRQSLAKSMADCQRYYQVGSFKLDLYGPASGIVGSYQSFPVTLRAAPTVTPTFTTQSNCSGGAVVIEGANGVEVYSTATATGMTGITGTFTASAEL